MIENEEYIEYGLIIQTNAVLSIVICAPIGALLLNTLYSRLLSHDVDPDKTDNENEEDKNLIELNEHNPSKNFIDRPNNKVID